RRAAGRGSAPHTAAARRESPTGAVASVAADGSFWTGAAGSTAGFGSGRAFGVEPLEDPRPHQCRRGQMLGFGHPSQFVLLLGAQAHRIDPGPPSVRPVALGPSRVRVVLPRL